jgi:capsular polysaccharide transport system ATP-binding protein
MITLENVVKAYPTRGGRHVVLDGVNLQVARGEKIGILGRNGSGKSTLIRLISGAALPTTGKILRKMSVSWPLAFHGGFQGSLTGMDNLRFICRIYGADIASTIPFVEEFTELGKFMREPLKTYSSGMRARLAFALSMAIEFDCFLIDEVIAVGDQRFHDRCREQLFGKRGDRAMIMVSHAIQTIRDHCTRACVLHDGKLHSFADVDSANEFYSSAVLA